MAIMQHRSSVQSRRSRRPRYPMAGSIPAARLACLHPGIHVVPGDTLQSLRLRLQARSRVWTHDLTAGYWDVWVWYCPYLSLIHI